jgi:hypothetical protein
MEAPLVSVVIDNYNYGRFLKQCIESVLAQDYPGRRMEIIVVDDGSIDDSRTVAAMFSNHVKLIAQRNQGQAEAFNSGIRAAAGELVMFLDADDYWDSDKVRLIADCFSDPAVGIVQHALLDVDKQGRALSTVVPQWPPRYTLDDFLAGGAALAAASGLSMRRSVLAKVGPIPKDAYYAADAYMIVQGLFHAQALNFPQAKGYHRIHGANNWAEGYSDPKKLRNAIELQKTLDRYLEPKLKERGLNLSEQYLVLDEMDIKRREILLAMHEGRRGQAWGLWRELFRKHGRTRLGFFRCATLLLALISPALYIRIYDQYRARNWLAKVRSRVFPG